MGGGLQLVVAAVRLLWKLKEINIKPFKSFSFTRIEGKKELKGCMSLAMILQSKQDL